MRNRLTFPHRRAVAALGSAAAMMIAGGFALDTAGASAQSISAQQQESQNWSGYVVQSSAGKSFSSVSGSWVEPSVAQSSSDGYSAFWVGIGGASNQSQALEQVGTSAQVVNGQTTYNAWYELVPSAQVPLNMTIHPGDHISAKVNVNGTSVTISITDHTTGQSVNKTLQMNNPDTSSAEWIAEAPAAELSDGSMQILPLADFGKVTFTQASATAGGHTGSISDPAWTPEQVDLTSAGGQQFIGGGPAFSAAGLGDGSQSTAGATPGAVSNDGSSFTVTYNADGSSAQSSSGTGTGASGIPGGYVDPSGYGGYGGYGNPGGYGGYGGYGYSGGYGGGYGAYGGYGGYGIGVYIQ
jgi:Peptidase A4 family